MATKTFDAKAAVKATTPRPDVAPADQNATKLEGFKKSHEIVHGLPALTSELAGFPKVHDATADDFAEVDAFVGRIRDVRKGWGTIWKRIQERAIQPIRAGLDELYKLNRDADGPLEELEAKAKRWLSDYRVVERKRIEDAERKKQAEEDRIRREAEEKQRQAAAAKTPQMRGRLEAQAAQLAQKAETVAAYELPRAEATRTTTRKVPTPVITDMAAFYHAIAAGLIPAEYAPVDIPAISRLERAQPGTVAEWPGIEMQDLETTAGR